MIENVSSCGREDVGQAILLALSTSSGELDKFGKDFNFCSGSKKNEGISSRNLLQRNKFDSLKSSSVACS